MSTEPTATETTTPTAEAEHPGAPLAEAGGVDSTGEADGATPEADETPTDPAAKALARERTARREAERKAKELAAELEAIRLAEARREVAAAKSLTEAQAELLVGDTPDELEAYADRLIAAFRNPDSPKPVENLRGGTEPDAPVKPSASQIADRIFGRRGA